MSGFPERLQTVFDKYGTTELKIYTLLNLYDDVLAVYASQKLTVMDNPLLQKDLKGIENPIANMGCWMDIPHIEQQTFKQLKHMGYVGVVVGKQKRDFESPIILIEVNPKTIFEPSQKEEKRKRKLQVILEHYRERFVNHIWMGYARGTVLNEFLTDWMDNILDFKELVKC